MPSYELEKLVQSLSAAEKKNFRLSCNGMGGAKDYLLLFDMISGKNGTHEGSLAEQFRSAYPGKSFENTSAYLFKLLTDLLVQLRVEQDDWYRQYHSLMKARLCFERSIPISGQKELRKANRLATANQHHAVAYESARMELGLLADMGFPNLTEQQLVDKQMKAKATLQSLRQIHEHYSLYELLSLRLSEGNLTVGGNKDDKKVNDLILSELSLTTRGSQHQFELQKLHLLFQSFFFIHTGEYQSALNIFKNLNHLIASHERMWDYPPYDYLSALDGILDSLRSIRYHAEMGHFIDKLEKLSRRPYPDHFKNLAQLTVQAYRLNMLTGLGDIPAALKFHDTLKNEHLHMENAGIHEKQLELLYFSGLAYFMANQWKKARKFTAQFFHLGRQIRQLHVYRAGRLMHILACYELDDMEYLEYEIRSYKRAFGKWGKLFKIEKLVFAVINADPKRRGNAWKKDTWKKIRPRTDEIRSDKQELQLLKFYDYCRWVKSIYSPKP